MMTNTTTTLAERYSRKQLTWKQVEALAKRIRKSVVFEDRLEYDVEDLSLAYDIAPSTASVLRRRLRELA